MNTLEELKLVGSMTLRLQRENGDVEVVHRDNIIVNNGFDLIVDSLGKATGRPNAISHVAVGTGTTGEAPTQTTLVTEIARVSGTYAHTAGTKVFTFTADFPAGTATGALTEAGVFNASSAGTMLDRVVFPVVNKGSLDTLQAVFTFTLS